MNLLQHRFCCFMLWFFACKACGILVPQPGTTCSCPALEGEVLTTGPPGKSLKDLFKYNLSIRAWSLGQEDPLEEEMGTHSSILAWRIPWTEQPGVTKSLTGQDRSHTYVPCVPKPSRLWHVTVAPWKLITNTGMRQASPPSGSEQLHHLSQVAQSPACGRADLLCSQHQAAFI